MRWKLRDTFTSKSRIDCGFVSQSLTTPNVPTVHDVQHIEPSSDQLSTLKNLHDNNQTTQSTWSDHAALQIEIRYSNINRAPSTWRLPNHILNNKTISDLLNSTIDGILSSADPNAEPMDTISRILDESHEIAKTHIKKKKDPSVKNALTYNVKSRT